MPSYLEGRAQTAADALLVRRGEVEAAGDLLALRGVDRLRFAYHSMVTYAARAAVAHAPCDVEGCQVCYGLGSALAMAIAHERAEAADA